MVAWSATLKSTTGCALAFVAGAGALVDGAGCATACGAGAGCPPWSAAFAALLPVFLLPFLALTFFPPFGGLTRLPCASTFGGRPRPRLGAAAACGAAPSAAGAGAGVAVAAFFAAFFAFLAAFFTAFLLRPFA